MSEPLHLTARAFSSTTKVGMEDPRDVAESVPLVDRAFAFVDLCGFTLFTSSHGEHAAIDVLKGFRFFTREVASRRGVVIAKWLGDGAMLVGPDIGPIVAATAELLRRFAQHALPLRAGAAHGGVLLFEGDDYIGRPVNLAARFCQAAEPGELLAVGYAAPALPEWMEVVGTREVRLPGLGRIDDVQRLGLSSEIELPALTRH
jgi:class 3 adenylate cyclase